MQVSDLHTSKGWTCANRVMTFEPTHASLDQLIDGLRRAIDCGMADSNAGVTLLLAELLKKALPPDEGAGLG